MSEFFFSVGSIILDDIVLPDGETCLGVLGGGATHAAMGMRAWTDAVGIVAPVGENFPEECLVELGLAFDLQGLQPRNRHTARAWQVYEADGRRTEVFRTSLEDFMDDAPEPRELPDSYLDAAGVHIQCAAPEPLQSWIAHLRAGGCRLLMWEPWDIFCLPENRSAFRALLPQVDVFSPNLREAQHLTSLVEPLAVARALLDDGAVNVALRMGEHGSLVVGAAGSAFHIPAAPVERIVDVTGAGNAYCGGFLVRLARSGDLLSAGHYGAVSAALALGQYGALYPLSGVRERAEALLAGYHRSIPNPRRQVFDRMAPGWDQRPAPPDAPEFLARVVSAGAIPPTGRVLDLGAGTGVLTQYLLDRQPEQIVSVDLSPAMLDILRDRFTTLLQVKMVIADGSWSPFPLSIFDAVFCHAVFPHFTDRSAALKEIHRVLKPGGRLVISHAAGRTTVNTIHQNAPDQTLHSDLLPPATELVDLLACSGWRVLENQDEEDFYLIVAQRLPN
jgi:sugar/nucleoside kinase (ribokinase family)/ubiquinone/menaquinone biosynthesis C-methylase UbiE